jgi:hypothetical protein
MAKRKYKSPFLMDLTPGGDTTIDIGGSQGSSGYDSMFTLNVSEDVLDLIEANCDDIDLAEMDTNGDYIITQEEFDAWYAANQPW